MKRRPILRGILSAGVFQFVVLCLWSGPLQAQSASPDITTVDPSDPLGLRQPDFSNIDAETKPENRVLPADHAPGDVHGVVRYPSGLPMAGAQVFVLNADVDVERSTVSAADGTYVFKRLKPGTYQIGAKIDGFTPSQGLTVNVVPGQDVKFDVPVGQRQVASVPPNTTNSRYRAYSGAYRAQPASLRVSDAEPAATGNSDNVAGSTEALTPPAGSATEKTPAAASEAAIPAAVADELAAMRKRIDELEAELKGRAAAAQPAATPAPAATTAVAAPQGAAPAAQTPAPTPGPGQYLSTAGTVTNYFGDTDILTHPAGFEPFSYADWTWMNANGRNEDSPWSTKYFTPEFRADVNYMDDFNHPVDDSQGGSTESFRSNEWQLEQLSLGGNINIGHVRGRILTMFGLFATTTPRNDASVSRGQWDLANAYRYISEGWGGYHFDVGHGLNVDAGIFVSYIGLFSYYNFDNWAYQPSYVSSNTPWFFNGLRIQYFPTAKLKIEPWVINGWQSYARTNSKPGLGGQILWRPKPWLSLVFNNYGMGTDVLGNPGASRIHTDDSVEIREFSHPDKFVDLGAMSATGDAGCQYGGGQNCFNDKNGGIKTSFLGWMLYQRFQFARDHYGLTLGGGYMNNPGRYLTLLPPINGANAFTGSPYFTENPGDKAHMFDATITADYMPSQWLTFRTEVGYRHADIPYWSGHGGITPPNGNNAFLNTGAPSLYVCTNGAFSEILTGTTTDAGANTFSYSGGGFSVDNNGRLAGGGGAVDQACNFQNGGSATVNSGWRAWAPDLRNDQMVFTIAIMTRF